MNMLFEVASIDEKLDTKMKSRYSLSTTVLSSKCFLEHILSYMPIESLCSCAYVNNDWYLIIKYIVPISLMNLKTLLMGELLYWLPGENKFPKTVLLKLKLSRGIPKFIEISTSMNNNNDNRGIVSTCGHYQILELNEILFIIDGHWTPIFEQLNNKSVQDEFGMDESAFFHRSKCFSIVTNTYMTYDFISFNQQTNKSIVNTLRLILYQTHELSSKMAIHAKANKKYYDGMNQTPLIFNDTLAALNFEMFVLILQDCINKISTELKIDIPSIITTQANSSLLYPMILNENVMFSNWHPWCRSHIFHTLKDYGYVNQNEKVQVYDPPKHMRRQSSLFGPKAFPIDQVFDLFAVQNSDDDEEEDGNNHNYNYNYNCNDDSNCLIM